MKEKVKFILLFIFCCGLCSAQQVISSGGNAVKSDIAINWALGGSLSGLSSYTADAIIRVYEPLTDSEIPLKVYPSPAIDFINLEIDQVNDGRLILELFDNSGVIILNQEIVIQPLMQVNISDIPCGIYYLKIFLPEKDKYFKIEKIVKIQTNPL